MAAEKRATSDRLRLIERLLESGSRFEFFATIAALERLCAGAPRVGGAGPYGSEAIRFRHDPWLGFNPGEVSNIEQVEEPRNADDTVSPPRLRFDVTTSFFGLTGSTTPLPLYIAEEILQGPPIKRDFLDLFHHRLIGLLYRLGIKFEYPREYLSDASDPWSRRMLALAGFDTYDGRAPGHVSLGRLLRLAPLFAGSDRSAATLQRALNDVAAEALDGATVEIIQFTGDWSELDTSQRMELGIRNSRLSVNTVLGVQCFHRSGKARIVIGPLHSGNFRRFLSDGDQYPILREVVDMLSNDPIEYDLDLVLEETARPMFLLGTPSPARLGVDSWIASEGEAGNQTRLSIPLTAATTSQTKQPESKGYSHAS